MSQNKILQDIARNLETILGDDYKVQVWTNIAVEDGTILATFRCKDDPKHYIVSMTKDDDNYMIGELSQ
jgi:hypothetical protein